MWNNKNKNNVGSSTLSQKLQSWADALIKSGEAKMLESADKISGLTTTQLAG